MDIKSYELINGEGIDAFTKSVSNVGALMALQIKGFSAPVWIDVEITGIQRSLENDEEYIFRGYYRQLAKMPDEDGIKEGPVKGRYDVKTGKGLIDFQGG